jgi:hypothetical protein
MWERKLRCALARALLHRRAAQAHRTPRQTPWSLGGALGKLVAMRNETVDMKILYLNNNPNLTMDQWALESEPMTNPKLVTEPESTELLDRLGPGWQLRLHDGAIIDHILKVIHKHREGSRIHTSLSNSPRWLRPGARQKTTLTLARPLSLSSPQESPLDQVKRLA